MMGAGNPLRDCLDSAITALGFTLWGCERMRQGRQQVLRVYIERPEGVTIDHCAEVGRHLNVILNEQPPFRGQYILEVSSPGVERFLFDWQQFEQFVGHRIKIRLSQPRQGQRQFCGELLRATEAAVVLEMKDHDVLVPLQEIASAQVVEPVDKIGRVQ